MHRSVYPMKKLAGFFILLAVLGVGNPANAIVRLRSSADALNEAAPNGTIAATAPATISSGDLLMFSLNAVFTGASLVLTAPSGWTVLGNSGNDNNQWIFLAWKTATASEPASYTFTLNNTPLRWYTHIDSLYDGGAGSLSVSSSQFRAALGFNAPNTSSNWDAVYGMVGRGSAAPTELGTGDTNERDQAVNYRVTYDQRAASSQKSMLVGFATTPVAGAPPTIKLASSGATISTGTSGWAVITGGTAPSPDYRLRATNCAAAPPGAPIVIFNPGNVGDLLLAFVAADGSSVISAQPGWTTLQTGVSLNSKLFSRTADSAPNYSWSIPGNSAAMIAIVYAFYDNGGATLTVRGSADNGTVSSATATGPTITPLSANDIVLASYITKELPTDDIWDLTKWIVGSNGVNAFQYGTEVAGFQRVGDTGWTSGLLTPAAATDAQATLSTWEAVTVDIGVATVAQQGIIINP